MKTRLIRCETDKTMPGLVALGRPCFALFCLLFFSVVVPFSLRAGEPYLTSEEVLARLNKKEIVLIDIRSMEEWRQTGVALGAKTISMHSSGFVEKVLTALEGDKSKPIALICARGGRSDRMQGILVKSGFKKVYDVTEGMLGTFTRLGWIDKKLPLRKYEN